MCDDIPLPSFTDLAPPDRYCDLILTGGVTSAIAYPAAIFRLAMSYRFNAIGGSSSGAGSAALAAAAEYRRRHGSTQGFQLLLERTDEVSRSFRGRTGLHWLFQPERQHRRLFEVLVPAVAAPEGTLSKALAGFIRAYVLRVLAGVAAVSALIGWKLSHCAMPESWRALSLVLLGAGALAALLGLVAWGLWRDVARVVDSDYGLCSGLKGEPGAPRPPLTAWLHGLIQELAGRGADDPPLTFADLADAPGAPRETQGDLSAAGAVSIRLQMITSNVTQGRPYVLPLEADDPPLYFRPCEMRRLFPDSVVEHLKRHSPGQVPHPAPPRLRADRADDDALWRLPTAQLPVVVASRMSVSFPVLFTAVPLWAADGQAGPAVYRRCLFSDAALCSNFPIHLFDSPVPAWPTFGISLHDLPDAKPGTPPAGGEQGCCELQGRALADAVRLPKTHTEGQGGERWNLFDEETGRWGRLKGFVGAMFSTIKDWNDATLARLPGVRERVARVGLPPGIGGLNILMNRQQIHCLSELGGEAARQLQDRFATPKGSQGLATGWAEHRWVRFNLLRLSLSQMLQGLAWSAENARHAQPLREQILAAVDRPPLVEEPPGPDPQQLLPAQAAALQAALSALLQAERALNAPGATPPYQPQPHPVLAVRPPL